MVARAHQAKQYACNLNATSVVGADPERLLVHRGGIRSSHSPAVKQPLAHPPFAENSHLFMAFVGPDDGQQSGHFGFGPFNHLHEVAVRLGETTCYPVAPVILERRLEDSVELCDVVMGDARATTVDQAVKFSGQFDLLLSRPDLGRPTVDSGRHPEKRQTWYFG